MQLGMIGLGRMGANLTRRLMRDGHEMVVWNRDPAPTAKLASEGAVGSETPADLVAKLDRPRAVWIMVPAAVTGQVVSDVAKLLDSGDTIIDGGNSYYRDDIARAAELQGKGHPLRRRRHLGRRLRPRARLLPDDRRRGRRRRPARPDLRHHRPRCRRGPAHARADRRRRDLRARISALRAERRRALREDGAQRDRVRHHGRVRRGASTSSGTPTPGCASAPATPRPRRSTTPSSTATRSTRPRSRRCGGAAASSARGCST